MGPLPFYLIKVILCSGILYAYYLLALRNNRFHQWNRYYLLMATLLSLLIPLLRIPLPADLSTASSGVIVYTTQIVTLREQLMPPPTSLISYQQLITLAYSIVLTLLLLRVALAAWKIGRLIRRNTASYMPPFHFIRSGDIPAPFSFFNYIFWDLHTAPDSEQGQKILRHELVHVKEYHSFDKLFMEIASAICWINPFFHLYRRELAIIHEFIADHKAAGGDNADYAAAILEMAMGSHHNNTLINSFFHHPLKRRILMLTSSRTPRFSYLRRIMVLPLGVMIFSSLAFVADQPLLELKQSLSKSANITLQLPAPAKPDAAASRLPVDTGTHPAPKEIFNFVEQPPTFPGGQEALVQFLSSNVKYPQQAQLSNISGMVLVQFIVDDQGNINSVKTIGKQRGGGLEEEAIRVVKAMPKWTPGKQKGVNVNVMFNLPIRFSLENQNESQSTTAKEVFTFVEQPPAFPGGEAGLATYLSRNIKYPREAQEKKISATIFVQMLIDAEGTISDVKTIGSPKGFGLEEEAIRAVNAMPKWRPGVQNGHPVTVQYNLPIRFTIHS